MIRSIARASRWWVVWSLVVACGPPADAPAPPGGNPDAGEGVKAKREARVEDAGVMGAMNDADLRDVTASSGAPAESIGGLIGGEGLGARGNGIGGGGLGGLGTSGKGAGPSGYGGGRGRPVDELPTTESYTDAGVNGFVDAATDRVSTFSIDVDTASYAIARRKLTEGQLPPTAAVRVEEFVNSFAYDYAPPSDGALFRVHGELAPHPFVRGHHVLRVALKGQEIPTARQEPVHLTFLVDTSGSMRSADKLSLAQRALHYLVDNLQPEDTVAIATYAGDTRKVLGPTAARRAQAIHGAIDGLQSGGGTAMDSGMALAYDMAQAAFVSGAENRVIVLSDGDANIGPSTPGDILETISRYAGRGITLSTVGFGMGNYQDSTMEQLADKGDGNYAYVDSMAEAKKVFGTDLAGTIRTIARDVKIQVDFDPAQVRQYRLIGYENRDIADRDFRNDHVDAGEVGSGHQVTAVYDLVLAGPPSGTVATVRLRAKPPGPDVPAREWAVAISARSPATFAGASADLRFAVGVATFAELLRASPHANGLSYDDVLAVLEGARNSDRADHTELVTLVQRAKTLAGASLASVR